MSGLPGPGYYYGQTQDSRRGMEGNYNQSSMNMGSTGPVENAFPSGQSLDEIMNQNTIEMMRRNTPYQPQYRSQPQGPHVRRASVMEFSGNINPELVDFQFDPNPASAMMPAQMGNATSQKSLDPRKVRSREDLNIDDTRFNPQMNTSFGMYPSAAAYSPALVSGASLNMDTSNQFMPPTMDLQMEFEHENGEATPMQMRPNTQQPMFTESPMDQTFPSPFQGNMQDSGGGGNLRNDEQSLRQRVSQMRMPDTKDVRPNSQQMSAPNPLSANKSQTLTDTTNSPMQPPKSRRTSSADHSNAFSNMNNSDTFTNANGITEPPTPFKYASAYSSSGFDMLGVLMRVAGRKNPDINIGPVDLSCAFVVCDVAKHDLPIVYCSDMFERLTGYSKYEILGRNCRFLQAPDGKVQAGVKRKYVDDQSVLKLKNKIAKRAEAQISLINYRKGGQPFMNLLTMIPVTWDTDEYRYYIGFQVDLVEHPNSVQAKNPDGSYAINYQRGQFPRYVLQTPETNTLQADMGQTIGRDEVSTVLSTIGQGESDLSKRIWDKVLLENTDDVVHVLSLKGLFLYLSPASRKVLEYDASELVGTALSSVCHPSDIVPVTRELKDASSGTSVNVVFRIRRKHSGYTWFESHGCLHTEQGKGRKCIILVGRQKPVYAIDRREMASDGGIADNELWTKMSTSGMFLYVSSNARALLDRTPDDLVGTSIQALMRPESKKDFGSMLEVARTGEKVTIKHDIQSRRGQVLQAQSTIYPGDAEKGQKPTFLVAQTRFVSKPRSLLLSPKPTQIGSPRTDVASVGSATPSTSVTGLSSQQMSQASGAGKTDMSLPHESGFVTQAGSSGLAIGNQDEALASEDNIFDELKTTRSTSWQFELRQMEKQNRVLVEELQGLLSRKKKRKRRKGMGQLEKDCANCHKRVTPEWRRGPSGNRDLCNSCGLRWAKQNGRVSPRKYSGESATSASPQHTAGKSSPFHGSMGDKTPHQASTSAAAAAAAAAHGQGLQAIQPKQYSTKASSPKMYGSMPPKIDEAQEPAHAPGLPV